jgi:hypothetical protein
VASTRFTVTEPMRPLGATALLGGVDLRATA